MNGQTPALQKSAEFESPVLEVIRTRRSRRAYSDRPINQGQIDSLFEAARWAPSSVNEQPWLYLYATNEQPKLWGKLFNALNDSNKVWAKNAPLLILSLVRKNFLRNGFPNHSARYDLGGANAFLSLQATALGLNVHQVGGFDHAKMIENLSVPDNYEPVTVMVIGYLGDVEHLPEHLRLRELAPRERYQKHGFVMNTTFHE